jgi:hypothetical protein
MAAVFLSYRREDSAAYAGRLYDRLVAHFGDSQVFMDIDQIGLGEDFVEVINQKVSVAQTVIVLIGRQWLTVQDEQGKRRLDDAEDFVRLEVGAALERRVRVIPVLVGGAAMPKMQQLPEPLAMLSRRNAIEISDTRFHHDVGRLIEALEQANRAGATAKPASASDGTPASTPVEARHPDIELEKQAAEPTSGRGRETPGLRPEISATAGPGTRKKLYVALGGVAAAILVLFVVMRQSTAPTSTVVADDVAEASKAANSTREVPASVRVSPLVVETAPSVLDRLSRSDRSTTPPQPDEQTLELAKAGSAAAQYELGVFYETLGKNLEEAAKWYGLAAAQGNKLAREGLTDVKTQISGVKLNSIDERALYDRQSDRMRKIIDDHNETAKAVIQNIRR